LIDRLIDLFIYRYLSKSDDSDLLIHTKEEK